MGLGCVLCGSISFYEGPISYVRERGCKGFKRVQSGLIQDGGWLGRHSEHQG